MGVTSAALRLNQRPFDYVFVVFFCWAFVSCVISDAVPTLGIPQTPDTWQVEWVETTRDRQGSPKSQPVTWRALVTTYIAEVTPSTTDEQLRNNPLSIFVRDYSWSRVQ